MAESKYLKKTQGNGASTTLSASITNADTAAPLTSDTAFDGEGMLLIDEGQSTEEFAYGTAKVGSSITILADDRGLEGGSAQAHTDSATVKGIITSGMWNNVIEAVSKTVSATTGALDTTKVVDLTTAQTLTNKTLTSPVVTTPQINDTTADHQYITAVSELTADRTVTLPLLTGNDEFTFNAHAQTLTNKRTNPRIVTAASYTTDTGTALDVSTCDEFDITAQAGALKLNNPGGTPVNGQKLIVRIKDNGTARALTYDTQFRASTDLALPTTTTANKTIYMGFVWNAADSKWDLLAVLNNF